MDVAGTLKQIPLFSDLADADLAKLAEICEATSPRAGEVVFEEGDPGGSLFVVADGTVKLIKAISQGVDKDLLAAGKGMVFGEISFIDKNPRSARAVAVTDAEVIALDGEKFAQIAGDSAAFAGMFAKLSATVADRLRLANDLLKETLLWGLQAAGGAALNLDKIITDSVSVTIDLTDGKQLAGRILKVEQSMAGYEVTIQSDEDALFLVPYHAIARVYF